MACGADRRRSDFTTDHLLVRWAYDWFGSTLRVLPAWLPRQKSLRFLP
jgi:hypothetical protein